MYTEESKVRSPIPDPDPDSEEEGLPSPSFPKQVGLFLCFWNGWQSR